jgi:hypothetical protein
MNLKTFYRLTAAPCLLLIASVNALARDRADAESDRLVRHSQLVRDRKPSEIRIRFRKSVLLQSGFNAITPEGRALRAADTTCSIENLDAESITLQDDEAVRLVADNENSPYLWLFKFKTSAAGEGAPRLALDCGTALTEEVNRHYASAFDIVEDRR